MITNRCNLKCSYCVLENAPYQLNAELDLKGKKELISHLYHKLGFRRITLSGGEALIIGKHPPRDFIELLHHIRNFRSTDSAKNLEIELYTNGTYLDENVISEMKGVIDMVAMTIDSTKDSFLSEAGRNYKEFNNYFEHTIQACNLLTRNNIKLKLHSVISQKNYLSLADEIAPILDSILNIGGRISCWKFYQYMSYDAPEKDNAHAISTEIYEQFKTRAQQALGDRKIHLHFKNNKEMSASLFNILSYGNAQYMRANDTWLTSQRTADLRTYNSMQELFTKHDIDVSLFRQFHEIYR